MYARNITRERNPAMAAPLWHPRRARTAVKDDAATPAPSRVARTSSSARPQRANRRPVPTSASLPLPRATREAAVLAEGAVAAARTPSQRGGGAEAVEDAPAPARAEVVALAAKVQATGTPSRILPRLPCWGCVCHLAGRSATLTLTRWPWPHPARRAWRAFSMREWSTQPYGALLRGVRWAAAKGGRWKGAGVE